MPDPMTILNQATDFGNTLRGIEFPLSVLPRQLQDIVTQLTYYNSFPAEYTAASIVTLLGLAIGTSYKAHVMAGWDDTPIIYMALVGEPGTNKSNPLKFLIKPFNDFDRKFLSTYNDEKRLYDEEVKASKGKSPMKPPMYKCFVTHDVTTEAVQNILAYNRRGIILHSDELIRFVNSLSRYHNASDVSFWLSLFDGGCVSYDRKTNNERVQLDEPFCSVIGTIQPGILSDMMKGELSKNGFIERFLFVYPRIQEKAEVRMLDLPMEVEQNWNRVVGNLLGLRQEDGSETEVTPTILHFTDKAKEVFLDWSRENKRISDSTDSSTMKGICSKFDKYIVRLSLILQLARWACGEANKDAIDDISVTKAALLIEYFREQAVRVQSDVKKKCLDLKHETLLYSLTDKFSFDTAKVEGNRCGLSESTVKRFLKEYDGIFFKKVGRGEYFKITNI